MNRFLPARLCAGLFAAALLGFGLSAAHAQAPADTTPPATMTEPVPATEPAPPVETTPETPTQPEQAAPAPAKRNNRFRIGPEIGLYLPTSSKTRSEFGSSALSLGIGLGSINKISTRGQTTLDLQVIYQSKDGNHMFLAPLGVGYRKAFSQNSSTTTYLGATADIYFADLRSGKYNVHSGVRTGFGGSVLAGVNFSENGYFEARYLIVSRIKGFDLSGVNLTAGYRF